MRWVELFFLWLITVERIEGKDAARDAEETFAKWFSITFIVIVGGVLLLTIFK